VTLEPVSRAILVVDIEKSSERTDTEKADLRAVLYQVLHDALDAAGLPAERRRLDDLGDGVLVVADSEVLPLLDPLADVVVDGLARHNAGVRPEAWLRLRLGVHFGLVARDEHGWVGDAMTTAFRIVNGEGVKEVLRAAGRAQSVVVVSEAVHDSVVRHGYRGVRSESYGKLVDDGRAVWVRVPGYAKPPLSGDAPKATDTVPGKVFNAYNNGHVFNADTMNVDARTGFGGTGFGGTP
jgi:class 3 adenylate cyclase